MTLNAYLNLALTPFQIGLLFGVIGFLVGGGLNLMIQRLPMMMTRQWEKEMQEWAQLDVQHAPDPFPPFRFLLPRHLFVQVLSAMISIAIGLRWGLSVNACAALFFSWILIALALIDLDTLFLPDSLTQPLLWVGLIFNASQGWVSLESAVWGAVWGYSSLWGLYWVFKILTGQEGIGQGDFKLLAALGAWLGWQSLTTILMLSSIMGGACGLLVMLLSGASRKTQIPFGPFLSLSGLTVLFVPLPLGFK